MQRSQTFLAVGVLFLMGGAPIRDFSTTLLGGYHFGDVLVAVLGRSAACAVGEQQREGCCSSEELVLPELPVNKGQCREAT